MSAPCLRGRAMPGSVGRIIAGDTDIMVDTLGWRAKFAVLAPSTNTSVQPEYDDMRPAGVTNHFCRIPIPDIKVTSDDSFMVMLNNIRNSTLESADVAMTMDPGCLIMGMSAETFWDG